MCPAPRSGPRGSGCSVFPSIPTSRSSARRAIRFLAHARSRPASTLPGGGGRSAPQRAAEIFQFYRDSPEAMQSLQAPIFEDKVVDFIVEMARVTDRTVSVDELTDAGADGDAKDADAKDAGGAPE